MKCIIVDDEFLAIARLESLLLEVSSDINLLAKCQNGIDASTKINTLKPDVVFLDIQMPEINGFEVVEKLTHIPIIIFTTAYDEYALKAFQAKAIRYLLKPIKKEELKESVQYIENKLLQKPKDVMGQTIVVKELGRKVFIPLDKIELISTFNRIVFIYFEDKKVIADKGMDDYESMLPVTKFFRSHRSYLINVHHIESIKIDIGGKRIVTMKSGQTAVISRDRVKAFENVVF